MSTTVSPIAQSISCPVAAWASVRANAESLTSWRQAPGTYRAQPLPTILFKNSEEQTIAGMMALLKAICKHDATDVNFEDWGVVAGPGMFGRGATAQSILRYEKEGAWGVSPHMIPHHSLHALSGTISLALKMHGPNFTVDGGRQACAEAFFAAAALLLEESVTGIWLIMTDVIPEFVPAAANPLATGAENVCHAVALALLPPNSEDPREAVLSITGGRVDEGPLFSLSRFVDAFEGPSDSHRWRLPGTGGVRIDR